ncbi:MAG TPA: DinB family protein [Burkholderiales bacterium]|nr:DinB family protein [Burkholderiales bacterium]
MDVLRHIRLLAQYNHWMNEKIYAAAGTLSAEQISEGRGAFFGSILGTLNHLVVTDIIWLQRLGAHPALHRALDAVRQTEAPRALNQILHTDLVSLRDTRKALDETIIAWTNELSPADLDHILDYRNMKGVPQRRLYGSLVLNLFNHQTHHRGQATTLLSQAGVDVGVTDLLALIPQERSSA